MSCGKERSRHSNEVIVKEEKVVGADARKINAGLPYKRPQGQTPTRNRKGCQLELLSAVTRKDNPLPKTNTAPETLLS